jgi:hypothetical protein
MHYRKLRWLLVALVASLSACATTFVGDPMFPGGSRGCEDACMREGLVMSSYVFVGEYSTGCVCAPRPPRPAVPPAATPSAAPAAAAEGDATGATAAAAAGVVMQMRSSQQQQQQQNRQ